LVVVWLVVYWILPDPLGTWLGIMTFLAFGIWLYNRVSGRMKLPPLRMKVEKVETITLTHILLALLLLVMLANHGELTNVKKATNDVQDSVTDLQNSASDNTDEIKSSLDDVTNAIHQSQVRDRAGTGTPYLNSETGAFGHHFISSIVPSDDLVTGTKNVVTGSGSPRAAKTGEPLRFAPQLAASVGGRKNIRCGCQWPSLSFK
jgi:hypothetical protein